MTFPIEVPWLPELFALAEDMRLLETTLRAAGTSAQEIEAYKYSYRNCRAWSSAFNLYRAAFRQRSVKFWASDEMEKKIRNIRVRTLQIFGTEDAYLTVTAAKNSHKFVPDHQLRLLEGVSHWVQHQHPDQVNRLMEDFLVKSL